VLDPRRLRLLLLLESLGTVRAVAEAAAMSPSAVSQQLAALERESGAALLSRHGRTVTLTGAGVALAGHARAILERINAAEEDLRALRDDAGGSVGVAAPTTALRAFVIAAAAELARAYPGVSMQLSELEPAACLRALTHGEVDLAVVADFGDGTLPLTPHLRSVPLARDELRAVLGPGAPAGSVRLAALADEPWLLDGTELERHLLRRCRRAGFEPRVVGRLISHEALLFAVRSGLGVTVLPSFALHIADGVSVRSLEPGAYRDLLVLHRSEALDRRSVALALDALVAAARDARDADLAAVTVGPVRPLDGPVVLREPDPGWAGWYAREAERIRGALGPRVLTLEHVGSTSVPLVAKPRLDIVLGVADPADEAAYVPALEAAGYALRIREPDWHEHRMLAGDEVNLHVFAHGSPEIARMVRFRDILRADAGLRERYAAAKRELAAREWRHVQDYADAKTEVVASILEGQASVQNPSAPT